MVNEEDPDASDVSFEDVEITKLNMKIDMIVETLDTFKA